MRPGPSVGLRVVRSRAALLSVACAFFSGHALAASNVSAQALRSEGERWVVIPSTAGPSGDPGHAARKVAQWLPAQLTSHKRRALSAEQARRLFEQRGSAPPMLASASDIDALARDAQQALYHVASGLHARARADVARAMDRARGALESLNRETRAAQHLLDTCLYLVRAHLDVRDRAAARKQALECRRLVPDIEPEGTMHPPDVIGVLAEAEAELLSREPSSLRVESEPIGCAVFLNGRNLGATPRELPQLSPGEYRVQVECHDGEPGRVHRALLSANRVVMRVDTRFDRVVQTAYDLSLRYHDAAEERSRNAQDALEAARIVGATDVVLVWLLETSDATRPLVEARRYRVDDGKLLAAARLRPERDGLVSSELSREVVKTLTEGLRRDLTGEKPVPLADLDGAENAFLPRPPRESAELSELEPSVVAVSGLEPPTLHALEHEGRSEPQADRAQTARTVGYVVGGLGLAGQLVGWGLYAHLSGLNNDYARAVRDRSDQRFEAFRQVEQFKYAPLTAVGASSGLLLVALPLALPAEDGIPWWSWALAGVGAAGASVGTALALRSSGCERDELGRCRSGVVATELGPTLILQSVPLLSLPLIHGIRALTGADARGVHVEVSTRGGTFVWAGAL